MPFAAAPQLRHLPHVIFSIPIPPGPLRVEPEPVLGLAPDGGGASPSKTRPLMWGAPQEPEAHSHRSQEQRTTRAVVIHTRISCTHPSPNARAACPRLWASSPFPRGRYSLRRSNANYGTVRRTSLFLSAVGDRVRAQRFSGSGPLAPQRPGRVRFRNWLAVVLQAVIPQRSSCGFGTP